jgi:ribose 5-phosphate isomerase A
MEDDRHRAWAAAGAAAAAKVESGMRVGIGTGRAAGAGIRALAARVADEGLRITTVPTSVATASLARELGLPLARLRGSLDLAFDGADAVAPGGAIVKGAGGALVRERIVADASARGLVLVDGPKLVGTLDEWGRLPLAVVPFAAGRVMDELADLEPLRREDNSDDGLALIDLHLPAGADWEAVAGRAAGLPGVVDHGLFRAPLSDVLVGRPDGTSAQASTLDL